MKKKLLSILMCAAMAVSTFGMTTVAKADDAASDLDPVTLHFIFFGDKKSATDEVWQAIADYTRPVLNADFDVQFVAGDDYKNKLLVKAATGDVWDLNFDSNWTGYFQMAAKDAYMDLDELLPEYAPDLYAKYESAGLLDTMKSKGHITVLPWTMTMNNRPFLQWRGDLVEAAGIEVDPDSINTLEDVDAFLHELKEAYPDKYIIETGVVSNQGWNGWNSVDEDMGLYFNLNDPECKIVAAEEIPEMQETWEYAKKWQDDGLIWKDVLTDNLDHNSLINEGKLITKWGTHEFSHQNRAWVEDSAYWDYTEVYGDGLFANRTPLANAVCISATSENPERTLMFLNMLETDQTLYDMVQYGIEGVTYVLDGETAAYPEGMDGASSNYMEWGGQWALWKPQFMRPNASYGPGFWEEEANYAASSDLNVVSPLDGFNFDATEVVTQVAQRNQVYGDAKKLLDVGLAGDVDTALEQLRAESEGIGLEDIIEEYQAQIDEYLANK